MEIVVIRFKQVAFWAAIVLFIVNAYAVWPRLVYQNGLEKLQARAYAEAEGNFEMALALLPEPVPWITSAPDRFRLRAASGRALYEQATLLWRTSGLGSDVYGLLVSASEQLELALAREPDDYRTLYCMARTVSAQERAFHGLYPQKINPHNAGPFFERALASRPSGISVRYLYARYLYWKGELGKIPALAGEMVRNYPPLYFSLRREVFFNAAFYPEIEARLKEALNDPHVRELADKPLSRLYWDMGRFEAAVRAVTRRGEPSTPEDLVYLGTLQCAAGQRDKAFAYFDRAQELPDEIYGYFRDTGQLDLFIEYSFHARKKGLSSVAMDLNVARGLIKQGLFPFARARLMQVNAKGENAMAYELLAGVARAEGEWEDMLEMAEQGILLDGNRARLHYLRSVAYEKLKRFKEARISAKKAVYLNPENKAFRRQEKKFGIIRS